MNILFVYPTPFHPLRGGVGRVTDTLCRELQARGHNVLYMNTTWYREERKNFDYPAKVTMLPSENLSDAENVAFYHRYLAENKIDVVISQDGVLETSLFFMDIPAELKILKVAVLHNNPLGNTDYLFGVIAQKRDDSLKEAVKRIGRILLYWRVKSICLKGIKSHYSKLVRKADKIVLLSDTFMPTLDRIHPALRPKALSIPNPNTYITPADIPANKGKEVLYVGRLHNQAKRIDRLLHIWQVVEQRHPDWRLSLVGDGDDRDALLRLSAKLRLKNADFVGFTNPRPFYERASIVVLTSDYEGFGMTLTEGMQFGCVPVAFDSYPSVRDIIIDGETGFLAKPFSKREYADKLSALMSDEDRLRRMSRNAFAYIKKFDIEMVANQWEALFSQIEAER